VIENLKLTPPKALYFRICLRFCVGWSLWGVSVGQIPLNLIEISLRVTLGRLLDRNEVICNI